MDPVTLYVALFALLLVIVVMSPFKPQCLPPCKRCEHIDVINTLPPTLYVSGVAEAKAAIHPTGPNAINLSKVAIQRKLGPSL